MKIGFGFDSHKLISKKPLILGGVPIPSDIGPKAHSDGDALVHAVIDALLGAAKKGDIGRLFPDSDPKYKGIDSLKLLAETVKMIKSGFHISNVDATVILDKPKLQPFIGLMEKNIARVLEIDSSDVSVKAKTSEGLNTDLIECYAVCLLEDI